MSRCAVHDPTGRYRQPADKMPNGRRPCRWCHGEVAAPRRTFCSQECVDEFLSEKGYQHLLPRVQQRDNEVCVLCGLDTRIIKGFQGKLRSREGHETMMHFLNGIGLNYYRRFWEADHIVPRVRGGPNTLANLRTLCVPCHKAETKRLASERAAERRDAKRPLLESAPKG